jgi:hypothetical protein
VSLSLKCRYSLYEGALRVSEAGLTYERDSFGDWVEVESWSWDSCDSLELSESLISFDLNLHLKEGQTITFRCQHEESELRKWLNATQAIRYKGGVPPRQLKKSTAAAAPQPEPMSSHGWGNEPAESSERAEEPEQKFGFTVSDIEETVKEAKESWGGGREKLEELLAETSSLTSSESTVLEGEEEEEEGSCFGCFFKIFAAAIVFIILADGC